MASVASKWEWVDHQAHAEVAPESHPQHAHQLQARAKAQRTLRLRTADADAPQPYSPARQLSGFSAPAFGVQRAATDGSGAASSKHVKGDSFDLCVPPTRSHSHRNTRLVHVRSAQDDFQRLGFASPPIPRGFWGDGSEAPACKAWLSKAGVSHAPSHVMRRVPGPHNGSPTHTCCCVCAPTPPTRLPAAFTAYTQGLGTSEPCGTPAGPLP